MSDVEHVKSAEESVEYAMAFYFAMFMILLMLAILLSNHVTHKLHLHWFPEAAGTL